MSRSPRNVEEFRLRARRHLPRAVFDFVDGGADDEVTLRANRAQFERLRLVPRVLVDVSDRDLSTTVAGVPLRLPIIFAPAGLVGLVHPDGETAAARVAVGRGIIAVISGHAT
jgi:isopentenyl diphosphate isomerase/L-lactate dehydrogenase-like FMN-dependent dehydrogenase